MRFVIPIFLYLATAGLQTALTASLESADRKETFDDEVGELTELQKRDQMEFEAAETEEAELEAAGQEGAGLEGAGLEGAGLEAAGMEGAEVEAVQNEEDSRENGRFLEAGQDENEVMIEEKNEQTDDGDGNVDADHEETESESESESVEDTEGMRQKREHDETEEISNLDELIEDKAIEEAALE